MLVDAEPIVLERLADEKLLTLVLSRSSVETKVPVCKVDVISANEGVLLELGALDWLDITLTS